MESESHSDGIREDTSDDDDQEIRLVRCRMVTLKVLRRNKTNLSSSEDTPRVEMWSYKVKKKATDNKSGTKFRTTWVPDTGASMSVAPEELVRELGIQINKESAKVYSLENASDEPMEVVGTASLWINHPEATDLIEVSFLVTSDMMGPEFLLG